MDSAVGALSSQLFSLPENKRFKGETPESVSELFSFAASTEVKKETPSKASKAVCLNQEQEMVVIKHIEELPAAVKENNHPLAQYLAKLKLRQRYRKQGIPLFDLDAFVRDSLISTKCYQPHPSDPHLTVPVRC